MIWTVLCYNPVRIFGSLGILGVVIAGLVGLGLLVARLNGVTTLNPWITAALFLALVAATAGVSLFNLGATFNYLVAIFYKRPIRQGLFGKPIFTPPLDHQFGWMGVVSVLIGLVMAAVVLLLGWDVTRLWLYLMGSATLVLIGIQLSMSWLLMRVLDELSQREAQVLNDVNGNQHFEVLQESQVLNETVNANG
jgi:hypothetical protein